MDTYVKAFIKGSVIWLALGAVLGVAMAVDPGLAAYGPAHLHMLTLGFVAMLIFGVGYHVIPRIAGFPLVSNELPLMHWWVGNLGLAFMVAGFVVRVHVPDAGAVLLGTGGFFFVLGTFTFAYLVWRTVDGPQTLKKIAERRRTVAARGTLRLVPNDSRGPDTTVKRRPSHGAVPR